MKRKEYVIVATNKFTLIREPLTSSITYDLAKKFVPTGKDRRTHKNFDVAQYPYTPRAITITEHQQQLVEQVLLFACNFYDIERNDIIGTAHGRQKTEARRFVAWMLHKYAGMYRPVIKSALKTNAIVANALYAEIKIFQKLCDVLEPKAVDAVERFVLWVRYTDMVMSVLPNKIKKKKSIKKKVGNNAVPS